jgi:uncharacterized repeat protein (TIGR03803 family)
MARMSDLGRGQEPAGAWRRYRKAGALGAVLLWCVALPAGATTLLASFPGDASDGRLAPAALVGDMAGNLYGTTSSGGALDHGTVFRLSPGGAALAVLHSFAGAADGAGPAAALVADGAGNLYGTTESGGASGKGVVFTLRPDGTGFTVLHSFAGGASDGAEPRASLIVDGAGNLYGTTRRGGPYGAGAVFTLRTDGTGFFLLHAFTGGPDGAEPCAALAAYGSGWLYGTASAGGDEQAGVVFKVGTDGGGFAVLHTFAGAPADGDTPLAALVGDGAGNLYGATCYGGDFGDGVLFTLRTDGTGFAILSLSASLGVRNPLAALVLGAGRRLYGTARYGFSGWGAVFAVGTDGGGFTVLHTFAGTGAEGNYPAAPLFLDPAGNLYGTTYDGGRWDCGEVFTLRTDGGGFAVLHHFAGFPPLGAAPAAALALGDDGYLYGATPVGGGADNGVVFRVRPNGTGFAVLHEFAADASEGQMPVGGLALDGMGTLYGTTTWGGASGRGVVFRLWADGSGFAVLHSFSGGDGAFPYAGPILDGEGGLYGTTFGGGGWGGGVVYALRVDGPGFGVLHAFRGSDGATPYAPVALDAAGRLFGTTHYGGATGHGVVFTLGTDGGGFSVLHSFSGGTLDGGRPSAGVVLDGNGMLYGTTGLDDASVRGVVYSLANDGGAFAALHTFDATTPDGAAPAASALALDGAGNLYGTTSRGGVHDAGMAYTLRTDGTGFAVLHSFAGGADDGANPAAALVLDGAGRLYGTSEAGGAADLGTVFSLPVGGDQPPAFSSASGATFFAGDPASFTVATTGYPAPSVSCTGALPAGVSFTDNGDGSATLAGTAAATSLGTYELVFTAHNGIGAAATQPFTLVVAPPPPCALTCSAQVPAAGGLRLPVSFQVIVTASHCAAAPTVAWDFGDGSHAAGADVSHTYAAPGAYSWTLTGASGAATCSTSGTLTVARPVSRHVPSSR